MKKVYLFAFALMATFALNAQIIDENFDSYSTGDMDGQSTDWILWPGATSSPQITTAQAASTPNSMLVRNNTTDDILLLLGNQTSGTYTVQFDLYMPAGATGFYNFQKTDDLGADGNFTGQYFIGETASGGTAGMITVDFKPSIQIPYPVDTWFTLTHVIDLDNSTIKMYMDGAEVMDEVFGASPITLSTEVGAVDFFSIDENTEMYVDNVLFSQGNTMGTEDFSVANFSVYPNPIDDVLNIRSAEAVSSITVYNLLGKTVLQTQPGIVSPSIDTRSLSSGVYLVQIEIGGSSKTVKIIK